MGELVFTIGLQHMGLLYHLYDLVAYLRFPRGAGCIHLSIFIHISSNHFPSNLAGKELKLCIYQRNEVYSKKACLITKTV